MVSYLVGCSFSPPQLIPWFNLLSTHATLLILCGLPVATLQYYIPHGNASKIFGVTSGIVTAVYIPWLVAVLEPTPYAMTWTQRFVASTFGFASFFRCIAGGYQQYPTGAHQSLYHWLLWSLTLPEPSFVKGKFKKMSKTELQQCVFRFGIHLFGLSILTSLLIQQQTPISRTTTPMLVSLVPNNWLVQMLNGYIHLLFLYFFLSFSLEFNTLLLSPSTGFCSLEPSFLYPLWKSRRFSEAWGHRWNLPIHSMLKRSVYKPCRKLGLPKLLCVLLTFVASGLIHEYTFSIHNKYHHNPGIPLLFFVLMAIIMIIEDWLIQSCPKRYQVQFQKIPTIVIAVSLSLAVSIPFETYFIPGWLASGVVQAADEIMPTWKCIV